MMYRFLLCFCLGIVIAFGAHMADAQETDFTSRDFHSYANPSAVRVKHIDLDWDVLFDQKILKGTATLTVDRISPDRPLILDTRDLKVEKVETSVDGRSFLPGTFTIGEADKILGAPLTIPL